MKLFVSALALLAAASANAQEAAPCDWQASSRNLVEPWAENTRTFANGAVRLAMLDTVEPAAGAFHLLILSPPYGVLGERQCVVVGQGGGIGFAGMSFQDLTADYDPARGLIFALPVQIYLPEEGFQNPAILHLTMDQATGEVSIDLELGPE